MTGRERAGTARIAHSARVIAAVAWPLGQEAAEIWPEPSHSSYRGEARSGLRTAVVSPVANSRVTIAAATRGRRRTSATAARPNPITAYGTGSARWAICVISGLIASRLSSVKPRSVAESRAWATGTR